MKADTRALLSGGLEANYRRAAFAASAESTFAKAPLQVRRSPHVKAWLQKLSQNIPAEVNT